MIELAAGQAAPAVVVAALDAAVPVVCVPAVLVAGCLFENDGETRQGRKRRGGKRVQRPKRFRVGGVVAKDKQVARVDDDGSLGVDGTAG